MLSIAILLLISSLINYAIIQPIALDVKNSSRGVSRYQVEIERLTREINSIQTKIDVKSRNSRGMYEHYYSLYSNPVRYINQFVLSEAKPNDLLIISSSVVPNVTFPSVDREKFKPFLREYGISNARNLNKIYKVFAVTLTATGSFSVIGEYISNLYSLPLKFSVQSFELKESNNALILNLKLSFFVYNLTN